MLELQDRAVPLVEQDRERYPHVVGHFGRRLHLLTRVVPEHKRRNADRRQRRVTGRRLVQATDHIDRSQLQGGLLSQLPERRLHQARIGWIPSPSRQRHVSGPWVSLVNRAPDEQQLGGGSFRDVNTGARRLRPVRGADGRPEHERHGGAGVQRLAGEPAGDVRLERFGYPSTDVVGHLSTLFRFCQEVQIVLVPSSGQ